MKVIDSPIGPLHIDVDGAGRLTWLGFGPAEETPTGDTTEVERQLAEYFSGERQSFDLEVVPQGTPFQMKVWSQLREIPFGETWSYVDLAKRVGNPNASRAVGAANGRNPIAIVIPCHRVIGASGKLVGFGGGLDIKQRLLELEKSKPKPLVATLTIEERLAQLDRGENPLFLARMASGFAVMADVQYLRGYCLLLAYPRVGRLNDLVGPARAQFLADMAALGDAVLAETGAVRANYAIYGNLDPFLHAHVWPRYGDEPAALRTLPPLAWPAKARATGSVDSDLADRLRRRLAQG